MCFKSFEIAEGEVGRLEPSWGMYAKLCEQRRSEVAAKFVLEGEGRANEGWTMSTGVLSQRYMYIQILKQLIFASRLEGTSREGCHDLSSLDTHLHLSS